MIIFRGSEVNIIESEINLEGAAGALAEIFGGNEMEGMLISSVNDFVEPTV